MFGLGEYYKCLLLYGMLVAKGVAFGQPNTFVFEPLPPQSEIGQSDVHAILQDQNGFLWFGTWSGLWRYDAYNFRHFGSASGLNSGKITALYEENNGALWVCTRNTGLYHFDPGREIFEPAANYLKSKNKLNAQNITSVFRDRKGRYWIGAEEGLSMFDPAVGAFIDVPLQGVTPAPSENIYLYTIGQTQEGAIWVGGSHGLYFLQEETLQNESGRPDFQQITLHKPGSGAREVEFHNFVYTVCPVTNEPNALWVGTKQGLKRIVFPLYGQAPEKPSISYFEHQDNDPGSISHNFVTAICETNYPHAEALWVATFSGLNLLETKIQTRDAPPSKPFFHRFFANADLENQLLSNKMHALFFDQSGILWIGTNKGACKLGPHATDFMHCALRVKNHPYDEAVSFLSCTDNSIWASTIGGGIFKIPVQQGKPLWHKATHYFLSPKLKSPITNFISATIPDKGGTVWVMTQGAGAFRFREKDLPPEGGVITMAEQFTKGNGPLNTGDDYLMSGLIGQDQKVWIGCWDAGLNHYDPTKNEIIKFVKTTDGKVDFHMFPVVALTETIENGQYFLWAGTRGGGLFQLAFDETQKTLLLVRRIHREGEGNDRIDDNFITSLTKDSLANFWVTTESGLYKKNKNELHFTKVQLANFPISAHYEAIVEVSNGQYWVCLEKGIGRFDMDGHAIFYQNRNGLRERTFNSGAFARLSSGYILFGGSNGITYFDPNRLLPDTNAPKPVITGLRLFNRPVTPGIPQEDGFVLEKSLSTLPLLVLSHRNNVFTFEFSGLQYACPEQNRFAYKLEGFDKEWVFTDASQRLAHYTNLPYGDYKFLVKAANSDGIWNPRAAQLAVRVLPPWWRSDWAYTLYLVAFLGLLMMVRRITLLRANYENKIKIERLEKQKMAEVNQMKLNFFTNISHELKTPLTLIISPLEEMIRSRAAGNQRLHHTLAMMHRNATRLLTMISQLLDIRKSEEGLMKLTVGEGNIVQFVTEIYLSFRELAQQQQIELIFKASCPEILVWFDPDLMEKVFFNILSNALKFTPPGGKVEIWVEAYPDDSRTLVQVRDNGKGIPEDKLPFIFERFFRADEHDEAGGTGIGLSLVKNIVERHHGQVEVESTPGQGTVFNVWLSLDATLFHKEAPKRPTVHAEELRHYLNASIPDSLEYPWGDNDSGTALTPVPDAEKAHVLLVEDNLDIQQYLAECLAPEYSVSTAGNGTEGLAKTLENIPDLILCDISMPGMDGLELTRRLKSHPVTSHIPIILLTARTSLIFKIDGLEMGADDYVTKPFNLRLLQVRIRNLLDSRRRLREKYALSMTNLLPATADSAELAFDAIDEQFLNNTAEIVEKNLQNPDFSVDDLAQKLLMNRKQVYRKIKALTGQTPNDYIRNIRLKRAAQLLKTQRYTVAEITYKVGFQDLKYFRERFREVFGVNPSEFESGV